MSSSYPLNPDGCAAGWRHKDRKEKVAVSHSAVNVKMRRELAVSKCHLQKVDRAR